MGSIDFKKPNVTAEDIEGIVKQYCNARVQDAVYAGGVPNVTFIVSFDSAESIALRVGNIGYTRNVHLKFEIEVLSYLERVGYTWSPHLIPLLNNPGFIGRWGKFPVVAMKVIPGSSGDQTSHTPQLCFEIGKAIGEMRHCLTSYDGFIPDNEDIWSRSERLLDELETSSIQRSWGITPSKVFEAYFEAKREVQKIFYVDEVVHSDVWPPNILVLDGHLSGLIDFDDLSIGPGMLDLASAISEFCFDRNNDTLLEKNVSAIIQGFTSVNHAIIYEAGYLVLPLIVVSYCQWLACNAVHQVPFEETEIYYRRICNFRTLNQREILNDNLVRIFKES